MGLLADHRRVVVVTGAGISAASGIATYRDGSSTWRNAALEQMSHANFYARHLDTLWEFWGELRTTMLRAQPNAAHRALADAEAGLRDRGGDMVVVTQNIDGLHQRAGSSDVVELHGSIHRSRCLRRSCGPAWPDLSVPAEGTVSRCARCGRELRPDVVLFGEDLSAKAVKRVRTLLRRADLCLYVGTSGAVAPASELVSEARRSGARCILVNAEPWEHPHPDFHETLLGPAETLLPDLLVI